MSDDLELNNLPGRESDESTLYDHEYEEPLLAATDQDAAESQRPRKPTATPLPKAQLAALCTVRLVDPIAFTQVFPYVNEMMENLNLISDPSKTGFYSGIVESTFAVAQLFSIYQWARLSDIIGRRPVIIAGILGVSVTTLALGFSKTLMGIIGARFLAGLSAGNVAVVHSVLGEITDSTNQAIAFPIYGLCWPVGAIIGPLIGGTFSDPARKFPEWFDYELLRAYPYLLPGIIAAAVALLGAVLGYFLLEETLPSKRARPVSEKSGHPALAPAHGAPATISSLLKLPVIRVLCHSGAALAFITTAFDVVFVLFCYSPVATGGLGFSAAQIGYCLALSGAISVGIQVLLMPALLRTFDGVAMYVWCMRVWPAAFALFPLLNVVARAGAALDGAPPETSAAVWAGVALVLMMTRIACIAFSLHMILVRNHAPSPSALGTTNGLAQLSMSLARAFSPAFVSSAFALSVDNHLLGGHLWVIVMVALSLYSTTISDKIPAVVRAERQPTRLS